MNDDGWPAPTTMDVAAKTYADLLDDPFLDAEARQRLGAEALLGHAAVLLNQRGDRTAAELLLDVETLTFERDEWGLMDLWLEVMPEQLPRFTDDAMNRIRAVCDEINNRLAYGIGWVGVRELLPTVGPNWRDQIRSQLDKRPTNHARRQRTLPPRFVENHLHFTNDLELAVYRALKQIQENDFPHDDTFGIFPLAGGRLPGRTWEPDVLVTFKGRAGVLEIDGPHHRGRLALDVSRDHLWRNVGVAFIDRIPVEAVTQPGELNLALRRFLRRLADTK